MLVENLELLKNDFHFTIIGSGPASISLALELEKKDFKILILEAGNENISEESQNFYKGNVLGDKYFDLSETRLRCLGGSSQHWGGWCRTLDEIDFNDWPIKKIDLDPFLNQACNILNISNSFKNAVVNKNLNQIEFQFSNVRFKDKYFSYLKKSKKIFLALNTTVLKINGNNNLVKSIDIKSYSSYETLKVKNLILACGGLENSRILLWSQLNSENIFLKNLNIGHYWMEHPHYEAGTFVGDFLKIKKTFNNSFSKNNQIFFSPTKYFMKKKKINNCSLRFQYQFDKSYYKNVLNDLKCAGSKYFKKILENFRKDRPCLFKIQTVWEQPPYNDNKISLSNTLRDSNNIPLIELFWKKRSIEKKAPLFLLRELGDYFIKKNFGRIGVLNFLNQENDFFPDTIEPGGHHHLGGTRMGYSESSMDVVDKNMKVFGVKNLYIAGSSVFRTGGHANPTLTIVQLSVRLGNYLSKNINI